MTVPNDQMICIYNIAFVPRFFYQWDFFQGEDFYFFHPSMQSAQKAAGKFEFVFSDPDDAANKMSLEFIGSDFAVYDGYVRTLRGMLYRK